VELKKNRLRKEVEAFHASDVVDYEIHGVSDNGTLIDHRFLLSQEQ
jgi:hypothetical protein